MSDDQRAGGEVPPQPAAGASPPTRPKGEPVHVSEVIGEILVGLVFKDLSQEAYRHAQAQAEQGGPLDPEAVATVARIIDARSAIRF